MGHNLGFFKGLRNSICLVGVRLNFSGAIACSHWGESGEVDGLWNSSANPLNSG